MLIALGRAGGSGVILMERIWGSGEMIFPGIPAHGWLATDRQLDVGGRIFIHCN